MFIHIESLGNTVPSRYVVPWLKRVAMALPLRPHHKFRLKNLNVTFSVLLKLFSFSHRKSMDSCLAFEVVHLKPFHLKLDACAVFFRLLWNFNINLGQTTYYFQYGSKLCSFQLKRSINSCLDFGVVQLKLLHLKPNGILVLVIKAFKFANIMLFSFLLLLLLMQHILLWVCLSVHRQSPAYMGLTCTSVVLVGLSYQVPCGLHLLWFL